MSAHKSAIVRLGEAEYLRLRDAEERLRLFDLNQNESQFNSEESTIYSKLRGNQNLIESNYDQILAGINQELADYQHEINEKINQNNQVLLHQLTAADIENTKNAAQWYAEISENISDFERSLQVQQNAQNAYFQSIENNNSIIASEALNYIESVQKLFELIVNEYSQSIPTANELEIQRNEINQAVNLFNQDRSEPAWSIARNAILNLNRLKMKLENERNVLAVCQTELNLQASRIVQRINQQMIVNAMDADGNEIDEAIDVNYWTEGSYGKFVSQANLALKTIENLIEPDLNEMAEWREELQLLDQRALEWVTQARLAVLASQLRFNVAQIVVKALETQGFYLAQSAYQQDDFRAGFFARTRNLAGNEVIISIDPDPGLDEGGRLNITSGDSSIVTEHELIQRNSEIFSAIQNSGVDVTDIKEKNHPETMQRTDFASEKGVKTSIQKKPIRKDSGYGRR